ncbi:hypothetical protein DFO45_0845 [Azorhizobium sp. AG788]|jgi:uncharacterized membrane protein (UPF0127 family)|uniref:DUF192 domain-containing protein n=1 Tax=Azorhizobium sp. AG788 TaxID=2183897 RepID=UPI0010EEB813|nr:DUF192 domain-containing protein [Azorhizobium sp. AG788]TDT99139.1 hypothetical protein DFO45_0845 [Azorhizobium sp. AG788]
MIGPAFLSRMPSGRSACHLLSRLAAACVALCLLAFGAGSAVHAASLEPVEIVTRKGVVMIEVEVARTQEQRATGLMYRKSLPERQGMLFDFKSDQPVYMWMKNTFIPLDMLFIRADGSIARIAENTTPFSEATISSGEPVRAVIEIGGGEARKLGIATGDKVGTQLFSGN